MLGQSSGGSSSNNNSSSGGGGTKLPLGISRLSGSSFGSWVPGRDSKTCSVSTEGSDVPASDPNYIMQLVSDVRKFADVLLQLKDIFNSKGMLLTGKCVLNLTNCISTHSSKVLAIASLEANAPLVLQDTNCDTQKQELVRFEIKRSRLRWRKHTTKCVVTSCQLRHVCTMLLSQCPQPQVCPPVKLWPWLRGQWTRLIYSYCGFCPHYCKSSKI